jgi:hypothetical protein
MQVDVSRRQANQNKHKPWTKPLNKMITIPDFARGDAVGNSRHHRTRLLACATKHNTPIHNILSTALQLSISQKALGTLPEDGNVMPKLVGATIHN